MLLASSSKAAWSNTFLGCAGFGFMARTGKNTTRPVSIYVFSF
jgi:hypothetical protein